MNNLQKVIVLCVIILVGAMVYTTAIQAPEPNNSSTQIDSPSLELETGPEDTTDELAKEPLPPIIVEDFEGEADPNVMTLDMHTWKWIKTNYNNDITVKPYPNSDTTLTFSESTFSAETDCNALMGSYSTDENKITFSSIAATRMYCGEDSQESAFTKMLEEANSYFFTSKGELIIEFKYDSGSITFR